MIRVGTLHGNIEPTFDGFENIKVLTKSSPYGELGPYVLTDKYGRIMENTWQFSKCYKSVPKTIQRYSRWDDTLIWNHPSEIHIENDMFTNEFFAWRKKGMFNPYAVRYPVNKNNMKTCLFACENITSKKVNNVKKLDYVEARVKIYFYEYKRLVKNQKKFHELKTKLSKGQNLLITEVDGPISSSLDYYKKKYKVDDNFIERDTILVTPKNMEIMINDTRHAFGHGYCLAMVLLDLVPYLD